MNSRLRHLGTVILVVIALLVGMAGGVILDRQGALAVGPDPGAGNQTLNEGLINEAYRVVQEHYVDRSAVKPEELTYGAISGMVQALGDTGHTVFLTPEMVRQQQNFTRGQFEGIGAHVQVKDGHVVIAAPMDGSPAQRAGIRPGDIILSVNGEDVTGYSLEEVVQRVAGPAGTEVTLTVQNPESGEVREVKVERARIEIPSVAWTMIPGTDIALVRVTAFSQNASDELQQALDGAKERGARGIVLDLRNNPGGLLNEAVDVASMFLQSGVVVQERDAEGKVDKTEVRRDVPKTDLPMVVLINQGTASAAEIVSGALQAQDRAPLVGQTTFGTGTVLNQFELSDGSAILLAVEEWLTPDGETIWHQGISPDVEVELASDQAPVTPGEVEDMTPEQFQSIQDAQLLRALEVLRERMPDAS